MTAVRLVLHDWSHTGWGHQPTIGLHKLGFFSCMHTRELRCVADQPYNIDNYKHVRHYRLIYPYEKESAFIRYDFISDRIIPDEIMHKLGQTNHG